MTSRSQILTAKQWKSMKSLEMSIQRSQVIIIIEGDGELKNIAGQVLTYISKNFLLKNQKLDLERTMRELEKPFQKKLDKKNKNKTK